MPQFKDRKTARKIEAELWVSGQPADGIAEGPPPKQGFGRRTRVRNKPVEYYQSPVELNERNTCLLCSKAVEDHGHVLRENGKPEVPGHPVCPGDWIVRDRNRGRIYPMKLAALEKKYELAD